MVGRDDVRFYLREPIRDLYAYALARADEALAKARYRRLAPNLTPVLSGTSSNINCLAAPTGFEPVSPP